MTVHHETQTTQKACDARQRLLDAAIVVFANKGFEAASIREICSLAGVNIAGVNYYFRDKEKLYIEAAKHSHLSACGRVAESIRDRHAILVEIFEHLGLDPKQFHADIEGLEHHISEAAFVRFKELVVHLDKNPMQG